MDFLSVGTSVLQDLHQREVSFAAIGGFALGLWGVNRSTVDMDFLINKEDLARAEAVLAEYGYSKFYSTENVAQYQGKEPSLGSIDFILAFREISLKMLSRRALLPLGSDLVIPVLLPEDIIGLKVQALHNDVSRYHQDVADIQALLKQRADVDWQLIEQYFSLFGKESLLTEIRNNVHGT